jgi:hypothetical protein
MTTEEQKRQLINRIKEHISAVFNRNGLEAAKDARHSATVGAIAAIESYAGEDPVYLKVNTWCGRLDRVYGELPGEFND